MTGINNQNTKQFGKIGSYIRNKYGIKTHYCTDTNVRPAITETLNNLSVSGNADSKILTGTNAIYRICPGEEIIIPGAGYNAEDLTTIVTNFITRDTFEIKDKLLLSVENVNPKTTASTWVEI